MWRSVYLPALKKMPDFLPDFVRFSYGLTWSG